MPRHILSEGCFSVSVRYLTTNRDGVYWFYRRIPLAAKTRLGLSRQFVRLSLGTRDRTEAIRRLTEAVGDLPLDRYTRQNALAVRNAILSKNKTASVKRRFNTINAIFNAAIHGLKLNNPFSGIRIANLGGDAEKREEFTIEELRKLANACRGVADDRRLLILMLLDTGARLGEVVGLRVSDVDLGQPVPNATELPHIHIRPFDGRTLKTTSSTRKVPLVGEALWAVKKAMVGKDTNGLLFPDYGPSGANSASAALNKWIKNTVGIPKTIHGLRHSMKTRLVVAGVPEDIRNRIGGWTDGESVSRGYGSYPLEVLREHLEKVVLKEA